MVLRICFAALLAAILVAVGVPTLVETSSPAYAAKKKKDKSEVKEKEKAATKEKMAPAAAKEKAVVKNKAKKPPSEKQIAARQRMKDCGAEWQGMKKSGKAKNTTWRAFSKKCLSSK